MPPTFSTIRLRNLVRIQTYKAIKRALDQINQMPNRREKIIYMFSFACEFGRFSVIALIYHKYYSAIENTIASGRLLSSFYKCCCNSVYMSTREYCTKYINHKRITTWFNRNTPYTCAMIDGKQICYGPNGPTTGKIVPPLKFRLIQRNLQPKCTNRLNIIVKFACKFGHLDILKEYYDLCPMPVIDHMECAVIHAIDGNHTNIIEFVLDKVNIPRQEFLVIMFCDYISNNYVHLQLINSYSSNLIEFIDTWNIKFSNLREPIESLNYCKWEVIDKLIKCGYNVRLNNDELFKNICKSHKIHIAKQLQMLYPMYHFDYDRTRIISYDVRVPIVGLRLGNQTDCIVCLETKSDIVTTCNHEFCQTCIEKWLKTANNCPYCRQNVSELWRSFVEDIVNI